MNTYGTSGMTVTGQNLSTWRKTCPNANLSTTNPPQIGLRLNSGHQGLGPATNHLSHGTTTTAISEGLSHRVCTSTNYLERGFPPTFTLPFLNCWPASVWASHLWKLTDNLQTQAS